MGSICKQDNQMIRRGNIYIQKNCYSYPNFGVTKSDIIATGFADFFMVQILLHHLVLTGTGFWLDTQE